MRRPPVGRADVATELNVLVVVAALAALVFLCLPSCTGPAATRVARTFTFYASEYGGSLDYEIGGKRGFDQRGTAFGFSLNLGAAIPPDPVPVYVADPGAAGRPDPAQTPATPHHFAKGAAGCWRCDVPGCGKSPDEVAAEDAAR